MPAILEYFAQRGIEMEELYGNMLQMVSGAGELGHEVKYSVPLIGQSQPQATTVEIGPDWPIPTK
jgi:hypothetical protein